MTVTRATSGWEDELPTQFANPFRAAASADLVPVESLRPGIDDDNSDLIDPGDDPAIIRYGLLRPEF